MRVRVRMGEAGLPGWRVPRMAGMSVARWQGMLVASALMISVVQWFLTGRGSWVATLLYTLVAGNVVTVLMGVMSPLFTVAVPRNWQRYMLLLLPVAMVASLAGGVVTRLAMGYPLRPLWRMRGGGLLYGTVISYAVGMVTFAFVSSRLRMEAEKEVLARQVQRGQTELESHAAELKAAFEIQAGLLPRTLPQIAGVEISCAWQPARTVSGDFFDVLVLGEGRIGFCVADVSGKGMSAALVTANLQAAFRAFAPGEASPARVCSRLNEALCGSLPVGRFVTLAYGIVDRGSMELRYELAGHNPMLLLRGGAVLRLEGSGPVLGLLPGASFEDQVVRLEAGDRLLVTTDGVTEACGPESEEEFGEERVVEAARAGAAGGVHAMRAEVMRRVDGFAQGQFADDATMMVVGVGQ